MRRAGIVETSVRPVGAERVTSRAELRHAIRNIREIKRLNPAGYDWSKPMEAAQFAEKDVLDIAAALDIDLGTPVNGRLSFGDLDVREA